PIHADRPDAKRFRNGNSVHMKLGNYRRHGPTYTGKGLKRGNKLELEIWNEFSADHAVLRRIAQAIIESVAQLPTTISEDDDDESSFPEGRILYRLHRSRERDGKVAQRKKKQAIKNDALQCEVCDFDFYVR